MDDTKEVQTLRKAKGGDKKAIAALYDQNYQAVYRYIFYRISDPAAAEDLAAEVFIRLIRKLPGYRDHGKPLLAWLYTIARNLVTDHHRSAGKIDQLPLKEQIIEDRKPGPEQQFQDHQAQDCFRKALAKLPESQRSILIYRYIERYSTGKIMMLLEKSDRAIRSLQHRALRSLQRALEEEKCL